MTVAEHEITRIEKIASFYHSEFVTHNMPWVRKIPFEEYLKRELAKTIDDYRNV